MPNGPDPPVRVIAIDVWPPAMFSATQMPVSMVADAVSRTRLLKFPATPPRVIVAPVGLVVEPIQQIATARQLPAPVPEPRVRVRVVPEDWVPDWVWTRVTATVPPPCV